MVDVCARLKDAAEAVKGIEYISLRVDPMGILMEVFDARELYKGKRVKTYSFCLSYEDLEYAQYNVLLEKIEFHVNYSRVMQGLKGTFHVSDKTRS